MSMKVVFKEIGTRVRVVEVDKRNDCRAYKKLIGCNNLGYRLITSVNNVYMLFDDDYVSKKLKYNFILPECVEDEVVILNCILGNAVFVGVGRVFSDEGFYESDFVTLDDLQIRAVLKMFSYLSVRI